MIKHKIFWRILKLLNANTYFRNNITNLKHIGTFFIQHHTTHLTWYEEVEFKSYNAETQKYLVKKKINKHFIEVERKHIFLNAK